MTLKFRGPGGQRYKKRISAGELAESTQFTLIFVCLKKKSLLFGALPKEKNFVKNNQKVLSEDVLCRKQLKKLPQISPCSLC